MQFVYEVTLKIRPESHEAVIGTDFLKQNKLGPRLTINHFE